MWFLQSVQDLMSPDKAVSLLIPQISADLRTVKPFIMQSMYFFQVANDFLEENVIVLFLAVKVLIAALAHETLH